MPDHDARITSESSDQTTAHEPQRSRDGRLQRIWTRAYNAKSRDDLLRLYADWAGTYDADHQSVGFFGHESAARLLAKYTPYPEVAAVLDAGAGTGAAGMALGQLGYRNLTAVDLSPDMLRVAADKGLYQNVVQADIGWPLDTFPSSHFDAAVLVGVFSYGQAPAHALEEMVRVVKPGGVIVFTMRTDFFESDAMGVRSELALLERQGCWRQVEVTAPEPYLPRKDPSARFRVWCYRVLETKIPDAGGLHDAVRAAFSAPGRIKKLDHCFIWNSMASRLYNRYIEVPAYYLNDCEEEILAEHGPELLDKERVVVELGCGSARKIRHVLEAAPAGAGGKLTYVPIDLSPGALKATEDEIVATFGDRVEVNPRMGHFNDVLGSIPADREKVLFFFGSSVGNLESIAETVAFLRSIRDVMTPRDRFVVGTDLDKDPEVLRRAYEAGPANLSFFLNMIRRINNELGANLDVHSFRQESTYDLDLPFEGIELRSVNLKLRTETAQRVYIQKLGLEVSLAAGDCIQVGTSRKFLPHEFGRLAEKAGFRLRRQWLDGRRFYALNECVRDDATL